MKCNKCGTEKELSEFRKIKDRVLNQCRQCERETSKKYREENKEYFNKYYEDNKEYYQNKNKIYREKNKEKVSEKFKEYYHNNREYFREKKKEYNSSEKGKNTKRKWCNKYNRKNPHVVTWRSLLQNTIKRMDTIKEGHTIDLLGYNAEDLRLNMESKFTTEMCWENHGEWHIDHIKPVSSFDNDTPASIVCALDNLQPLWATTRQIDGIIYEGNLNKGDKYE